MILSCVAIEPIPNIVRDKTSPKIVTAISAVSQASDWPIRSFIEKSNRYIIFDIENVSLSLGNILLPISVFGIYLVFWADKLMILFKKLPRDKKMSCKSARPVVKYFTFVT